MVALPKPARINRFDFTDDNIAPLRLHLSPLAAWTNAFITVRADSEQCASIAQQRNCRPDRLAIIGMVARRQGRRGVNPARPIDHVQAIYSRLNSDWAFRLAGYGITRMHLRVVDRTDMSDIWPQKQRAVLEHPQATTLVRALMGTFDLDELDRYAEGIAHLPRLDIGLDCDFEVTPRFTPVAAPLSSLTRKALTGARNG